MAQPLTINGVIRQLTAADLALFVAHLLRLDQVSRHDRFQGGMSDIAVMLYGEHALEGEALIYGFFVEGQLRGAVELKSQKDNHELAFTVEKEFQSGGIGGALLGRALLVAKHKNIEQLNLSFLPSNLAMRHVSERFDAKLTSSYDQVTAKFYITARTCSMI